MVDLHEFIETILTQILESYNVISNFKDAPGDLDLLKKELEKINGLLQVNIKKIESSENYSDDFVKLLKVSKYYLKTYDFSRELNIMSSLYSTDSKRLKNIRLTVLNSLNDRKLIEKMQDIINNLKSE